jgi:hypothetical protein
MWKTSWSLSHWEIHDNPTTSKTTSDNIKKAFLAKKKGTLSISQGRI